MPSLSAPEFVARWQASTLSERSAAQSHFVELCEVLGQPTPSSDPTGAFYTFEKGVRKTAGGEGFADVWMRGRFAWEYKGKHRNLSAAYNQLLQYREDLENPPLLVVCDLDRFEVHTNFTNTAKRVYRFCLADLLDPAPLPSADMSALDVLRAVFTHPDRLRPQQTPEQVTEAAAKEFARLSESLRRYGEDPRASAHFLMRLLFCLFAEDIDLLPGHLFSKLVHNLRRGPDQFRASLRELFGKMAVGGFFGYEPIPHFDGGLFADDEALSLASDDMDVLARACALNWGSVEPAIFGTLFERSLDPAKRGQLGAHYTSRADILLIVEPVLMAPLRREWEDVQAQAQAIVAKRDASSRAARPRHMQSLERLLMRFSDRLASVRVLDPACGSGNFLYVALRQLLDLEKEVVTFGTRNGMSRFFPQVGPGQLYGIEIDPYAQELAQIVVWIGYIQWLRDNGFGIETSPILKPLHNITRMDAILARDDEGRLVEPEWPEADVIVGNPPFLGGSKIRSELGDEYTESLFKLYGGRLPNFSDLVCYWHERARSQIEVGRAKRAGLLATNSIRGGANRRVLERIKQTGDIFLAWSDRPWTLDGAAVRVSMVGFDDATEKTRTLDGAPTTIINPDLTGSSDLTIAQRLRENSGICFKGPAPQAPFDIDADTAQAMKAAPLNPNGRPNSDVIRPVASAVDIVQRSRGKSTIDFGTMSLDQAVLYEMPFEYVRQHIYPLRMSSRKADFRGQWWQYARPRPEMRAALVGRLRFAATPRVAKHRVFVWLPREVLANDGTIVVAREDDYFFGVLHSKLHELWALRMGTSLEDRPRYTPTTTFETFPFPWPPGKEPEGDPQVGAIAEAARDLVAKRDVWLNPEGATEAELKKRTLTNLYNERPEWLRLAHRRLDEAVLAAYGWPAEVGDEEILSRLLALNHERAAGQAKAAGDAEEEDEGE